MHLGARPLFKHTANVVHTNTHTQKNNDMWKTPKRRKCASMFFKQEKTSEDVS